MQTDRTVEETKIVKNNFGKIFKKANTQSLSAGFTLIELLVAMSLTLVVVSFTGFGLVTIMTSSSKAEAKVQRRSEINRALDAIANEVRAAKRINPTSPTNNATTTASAAVLTSNTAAAFYPSSPLIPLPGIDIANASELTKIGLYLEIPTTGTPPATCPTGGPSAGSAPPAPSDYDRVVYYVLSSTDSDPWLNPRLLVRYGRTPAINGTINPCSIPGKETFIDAISNTNISPTCFTGAISSGIEGFYTCVKDRQAEIFLRSKVSATVNENVNTKAFSRITPP